MNLHHGITAEGSTIPHHGPIYLLLMDQWAHLLLSLRWTGRGRRGNGCHCRTVFLPEVALEISVDHVAVVDDQRKDAPFDLSFDTVFFLQDQYQNKIYSKKRRLYVVGQRSREIAEKQHE